jgi:hypothetical protein
MKSITTLVRSMVERKVPLSMKQSGQKLPLFNAMGDKIDSISELPFKSSLPHLLDILRFLENKHNGRAINI